MELKIDFSRLFRSFAHYRRLQGGPHFCAFLFGDRSTSHVAWTFFAERSSDESLRKHLFLLNDSLLSDVELLAVLYVDDVEELDEDFLHEVASASVVKLHTSYESLLTNDLHALRGEVLGESVTVVDAPYACSPSPACVLASTSMSVALQVQVRATVAADLQEQFARYATRVARFGFISQDRSLHLHDAAEPQAFASYIKTKKVDTNDCLLLSAVEDLSAPGDAEPSRPPLVPIVHLRNNLDCSYAQISFTVQAWTRVEKDDLVDCVLRRLRLALLRQLNATHHALTKYSTNKKFVLSDARLFAPSELDTYLAIRYPRLSTQHEYDDFRSFLHLVFNVPKNAPAFRPAMAIAHTHESRIRNPHTAITNYKPIGEISVVKGDYDYHHYMQDGFDDNGWGCAYRSLQTIWSWFRLQGYTDKPVPTHREIQQTLIDIGDRDASFAGSRQWIGSLELSYVLETLIGVSSRIVNTNSGAEVSEKARQLAAHFRETHTPIMIGGGQYAYTILGVDFNHASGECRFLVLDPHYTGEDELKTIINKGWCAWKPASFWANSEFYNMLLPTPPKDVF